MRRSSSVRARPSRRRLDRLGDEGGFTLVEVMAALTVLAIGIFGAAQAITVGLSTTGLSRQRLAARSGLDQQMEEARALNYDNLVLSDPDPGLTHASDSTNPDYWVNTAAQTFDPDGNGPLSPEPIVRVAGASPALQHFQNPFIVGSTTYSVYRYVTWVDSPTDGTGAADAADGNNDGNVTVSDEGGHDQKRVTVVVVWTDEFGRTPVSQSQSSIFTDGKVVYKAPTLNTPPAVSCPTVTSISDKTVTFSSVASDSDGSIASVSWTFKSGSTTLGTATGSTVTYTFPGYSTYSIVNTVVDNGGGSSTNSSLGCTVTTVDPTGGNGGPNAGTIKIAGDALYTNTKIVTLSITKGSGATPAFMAFSNDGTTWAPQVAYSTTASWTLVTGDGTKTVYARFYNSSGLYSALMSDTIILDTTAPGPPTSLHVASSSTSGANKTVSLAWTAPTGVTDLGGYRLYRRIITSVGAYSLVCDTSSTSCSDTHKKTDSYEYYVIAYDLAGNQSAQSNHITA
jgi:prepilin-type N-terminal cleavage/methylation domain-containing protein